MTPQLNSPHSPNLNHLNHRMPQCIRAALHVSQVIAALGVYAASRMRRPFGLALDMAENYHFYSGE